MVDGSRILREYHITEGRLQGHGKRSKPEIADYILVYRNHKLATLEAKRWDLDDPACVSQRRKKIMVEALVAKFPVKAFDERVLRWLSRRNVM